LALSHSLPAKDMNWNCKFPSLESIFSLLAGAFRAEAQAPAIIPVPQTMEVQPGSFVLRADGHAPGAGAKILVQWEL